MLQLEGNQDEPAHIHGIQESTEIMHGASADALQGMSPVTSPVVTDAGAKQRFVKVVSIKIPTSLINDEKPRVASPLEKNIADKIQVVPASQQIIKSKNAQQSENTTPRKIACLAPSTLTKYPALKLPHVASKSPSKIPMLQRVGVNVYERKDQVEQIGLQASPRALQSASKAPAFSKSVSSGIGTSEDEQTMLTPSMSLASQAVAVKMKLETATRVPNPPIQVDQAENTPTSPAASGVRSELKALIGPVIVPVKRDAIEQNQPSLPTGIAVLEKSTDKQGDEFREGSQKSYTMRSLPFTPPGHKATLPNKQAVKPKVETAGSPEPEWTEAHLAALAKPFAMQHFAAPGKKAAATAATEKKSLDSSEAPGEQPSKSATATSELPASSGDLPTTKVSKATGGSDGGGERGCLSFLSVHHRLFRPAAGFGEHQTETGGGSPDGGIRRRSWPTRRTAASSKAHRCQRKFIGARAHWRVMSRRFRRRRRTKCRSARKRSSG